MSKLFILFVLFIQSSLFSVDTVTFSQLDKYDGQEIEIRGFLYQSTQGKWILAAEPNLRTCCVGSSQKASQQIIIEELNLSSLPDHAVLLRGRFSAEAPYYKMEKAQIVPQETKFWFYALLSGTVLAVFLAYFWKSRA